LPSIRAATSSSGYLRGDRRLRRGNLTSFGSFDGFLAKYSGSTGAFVWQKQVGGTSGDFVRGIGVDSSGNWTVVGYFAGTANFGTGALTSAGSNDVFVARYSGAGSPLFSQRYGDASDQRGFACVVDATGNVTLTGYFLGTINFGGAR